MCVKGGKVYGCSLAPAEGYYGEELPGTYGHYGYYGEEEYVPNYEEILHMFYDDDDDDDEPTKTDTKSPVNPGVAPPRPQGPC